MIFDVQISEQADRDLRGIFEYIAFELIAPENAAGQLERLEDAISKLFLWKQPFHLPLMQACSLRHRTLLFPYP